MRKLLCLLATAVVSTSADAAYVTYDISTFVTGTFHYDMNGVQYSTPFYASGAYSATFDTSLYSSASPIFSGQGANGSFSTISLNPSSNQFSLTIPSSGGGTIGFFLTAAPGTLDQGALSNIFTGEVISSRISLPSVNYGAAGIVFTSGPILTSIGTTISSTARPLGGGGDLFASITYGTVPELASWTMIVDGFGLIGIAMRRRKIAVSFG